MLPVSSYRLLQSFDKPSESNSSLFCILIYTGAFQNPDKHFSYFFLQNGMNVTLCNFIGAYPCIHPVCVLFDLRIAADILFFKDILFQKSHFFFSAALAEQPVPLLRSGRYFPSLYGEGLQADDIHPTGTHPLLFRHKYLSLFHNFCSILTPIHHILHPGTEYTFLCINGCHKAGILPSNLDNDRSACCRR